MGYSRSELDDIQLQRAFRFPPDLLDLLREHRPLLDGPGALDWLRSDPAEINEKLDWPFESFWFDVEHDQARWLEWGEKPADLVERRNRLSAVFAAAPKLIPLFGHRYLPEEPCEAGNPVFSVYQTDVICCGANLQDWSDRECFGWDSKPWPRVKIIPFWGTASV